MSAPCLARARLFAALVASLVAGCGAAAIQDGATPRTAPREPEGDVDDYAARIETLARELNARLGARPAAGEPATTESGGVELEGYEPAEAEEAEARPSTCDTAAELRDRICELARRICAIAGERAGDADLSTKCDHATAACDDATLKVERSCG